MRYLFNIAYDGTDFNGWQSNPNGRAVQDILERALSTLTKDKVRIIGASRTDSGVHALDQYAHFDYDKDLPMSMLLDGMNSILPQDVRIKRVMPIDDSFHSRYSASYKIYAYILTKNKVSLPILNRYSLNIRRPIDIDKMSKAIKKFEGKYDFSSFRAADCSAKSPVITIDRAEIIQWGDKHCFVFKARSFLQHMIRIIMGTLISIGIGHTDINSIDHLFEKKDRRLAPSTANAKGLFLTRIVYEK